METTKAIQVWPFEGAPAEYKALSEHGGDEDWLAFVPDCLADRWIGWLESGTSFGVCDVSEHRVEGGIVRIGAHA